MDTKISRLEEDSERFRLEEKNDKLIVTDTTPNLPFREDSFWDSIVRSRVDQLKTGAKPFIKIEPFMNKYHIAINEISEIGIEFNKKIKLKKISQKAYFHLVQNDNYLIVQQLDGPPFYKNNCINNKFFCTTLLAHRVKQLDLNVLPVLEKKYHNDGTYDIKGLKNDVEMSVIAEREIAKGVFINDEFISGEELNC